MKKFMYRALFLSSMAMIGFVSCGDDDDTNPSAAGTPAASDNVIDATIDGTVVAYPNGSSSLSNGLLSIFGDGAVDNSTVTASFPDSTMAGNTVMIGLNAAGSGSYSITNNNTTVIYSAYEGMISVTKNDTSSNDIQYTGSFSFKAQSINASTTDTITVTNGMFAF